MMASKCNKFLPNIFNKTKCQHCFAAKEAHSAAALENNKASRKVTKCGYLFVSPGYDFSNPLDRTRRWQRRLFRLYDDGELSYCVDENPDTVPQGVVDMNKCTDVLDAETTTTHPNSLAVVTPERTLYIKSTSREEIQWWQDTLAEFPKALKSIKPRRKQPFLILSSKDSQEDVTDSALDIQDAKTASGASGAATHSYSTFRGVRSMKHRYDTTHQDGLRKSSSLHDLSSTGTDGDGGVGSTKDLSPRAGSNLSASRFLSRSGDRLDVMGRREKSFSLSSAMSPPREQRPGLPVLPHPPAVTVPRSTWTRTGQPVPPTFLAPPSLLKSRPSSTASSSSSTSTSPRRSSFDDRPPPSSASAATSASSRGIGAASAAESRKIHRERSSSLKEFPTQFSLLVRQQQQQGEEDVPKPGGRTTATSSISDRGSVCSMSADETDSNETDELKMARSWDLHAPTTSPSSSRSYSHTQSSASNKYEDLYMKKGWLIKQGPSEKESKKHWFVLSGNSLRYYPSATLEESNMLDGRIDLSTCYEVSEMQTHRNYGFRIKTANGEYTLAAMTMGIRNNWMKAIRLCMELHNTDARRSRTSPAYSKSPPRACMDDLEFKSGAAASSTTAVTGAGGETAFQLIGRRDSHKRDSQKATRRHHSDVNPGNVSSALTVREFSVDIDNTDSNRGEDGNRPRESLTSATKTSLSSADGNDLSSTPRASKIGRHRSSSKENVLSTSGQQFAVGSGDASNAGRESVGRMMEGSDNLSGSGTASVSTVHSKSSTASSSSSANAKRGVTSESNKEEVKREMMRRAKSPSARVRDKTRASKSLTLHAPSTLADKGFGGFHPHQHTHHHMAGSATASDTGSAVSNTGDDPAYADFHMSEDDYHTQEDTDLDEVGSATASDVVGGGDEALVEILETEVESLKDRLEHTQTELDQVQKDNIDLKTRLHKENTQSVDSGYSTNSRWGQLSDSGTTRYGQASSTGEVQALKRQLKDSRDTVQRQRMEIEGLKSRLDMSVSKLTGTEKALSEALRDYKQEKDKFMKMSSEWNRRLRTMEGQHKDTVHKLELSRESLQAKERESRRLEAEVKTNLQKTREQEREILKLKAVEHEYKQLKEKLDDREHELSGVRAQLKEKEQWGQKQKEDYERQLEALDHEYRLERDDLEGHLEQLKGELYNAHDRQASMSDNMTLNMADMLREKDDIIAQLEEKLIEADKKMVDLSEELHAEMGENADLSHSLTTLRQDKQSLGSTIGQLEAQLVSMRTKLQGFESDNFSLQRQLEELRAENTQLHEGLISSPTSSVSSPTTRTGEAEEFGEQEKEKLKKTILELNVQIGNLQHQLERADAALEQKAERGNSMLSSVSSTGSVVESLGQSSDHQQDLLHTVLVVDSQLKEVNTMLLTLRQSFDAYLNTLSEGQARVQGNKLADLIEDIGHRCQDVQDTLRENPEDLLPEDGSTTDYKHVITVRPSSGGSVIMREYKGLKLKFDQAVAELRKLRREVQDVKASSQTVKTEDKKLKEVLDVMEGAYKQQIMELIGRVDGLSEKVVNMQSDSTTTLNSQTLTKPSGELSVEMIEQQLSELEKRITSLESQAQHLQSAPASTSVSESPKLQARLAAVKAQLQESIDKLGSLSSVLPSDLEGKVVSCKDRISSLSTSLQPSAPKASSESCSEAAAASAGVSDCLHEIREQVREIGEQLDSLEEGDEDSDSEDEGDQTTVEDIREKLAHLTEYIEEHSKMSTSDWSLLRLMTLQKTGLITPQGGKKSPETDKESSEEELKLYADKVSLEAVLLYEMAHILQTKDCLSSEDSVCREIDCLNSQLVNLHQKLDMEMKTMHFEEPQADLLSSYVELMAEKILINGQIYADTFDQRSHLGKVTVEPSSSVQPVVLATEALVRSQIDSFISSNMDNSVNEIMSLPSHLALRSVIQSELTYALSQLKSKLQKSPQVLQPGPVNYKFSFERLLKRQQKVFASIENYEKQLTNSLAVIIFKESEEMTIVEGPESVLEAMCSDLSTIMETHIQFYKEKCRSVLDTHSAHKYDLIVNELRQCRETVLLAIKSQHEAYASDPTSVRDSSLDIPVQSLDNTINNFGEILSLKAVVAANCNFLSELLKMGNTVLSDLELEQDDLLEDNLNIEKGLTTFVNTLTESLEAEALSKAAVSQQVISGQPLSVVSSEDSTITAEDLRVPNLTLVSGGELSPQAQTLVREAVFGAQLTLSLFKQKLLHEREMQRLKAHRPLRAGRDRTRTNTGDDEEEAGADSDGTLDLQTDFQALLMPLEEVVESKHEDELEVLQVLVGLVSQMAASSPSSSSRSSSSSMSGLEDQVRQLEQKLHHELEVARQRHATHLEVFKQESSRLEKTLEEQVQDRDHFEDRVAQLEEDLATVQLQHEEEKERVKQDILTAVHAIRSNEEKSETNLSQKASKLGRELAVQKLNFRKILGSIKTDLATKDKTAVSQSIEEHIKGIPLNLEEDEDEEYQPPLPSQPPPAAPTNGKQQCLEEKVVEPDLMLNLSHHEHEVEQLKKEKDEALAEEMRNTKAALDAVRSAYEDELTKERSKYKEALLHMYTEEYINEIRMRHMEEEDRMREELQKVNMHYSSKCEDYKLMEMKLQQTKHDFESHINQLIASNDHLESMLNTEIESLKEFIKNKPPSASLTTGSATMEEELYDSKIMVRVKDAELQKLRSQVKNLENSLHRTTEEQRQTMTQYMQALKKSGEIKNQYQEEVTQLTEKLHKVLGSQGLKANIRRTPSFHQRARSPSPQGGTSPRKEADHSSRDSHRRRHIQPKDLRRSKSSPSLPYVFDGKITPAKQLSSKPSRRSRSPKT